MTKYRHSLPQLSGAVFVTDGGIETTLIFLERLELPCFASFDLLKHDAGTRALLRYFHTYAELAKRHRTGLILESPTWRANRDWGQRLGYTADALADANRESITLLQGIRDALESQGTTVVISGNIGPRGDGYVPSAMMSAVEAEDYHGVQAQTFRETEADMVAAFTMNYVEEAVGIVAAAKSHGMPVAISFTVETDGRLPTGQTLREAIEKTDEATDGYAVYYMINCAHPTHFKDSLVPVGDWLDRIRGLRANSSKQSHAELNESTKLDRGNPIELGEQYRALRGTLKNLCVIGGCCGTDHQHVDEICKAFLR